MLYTDMNLFLSLYLCTPDHPLKKITIHPMNAVTMLFVLSTYPPPIPVARIKHANTTSLQTFLTDKQSDVLPIHKLPYSLASTECLCLPLTELLWTQNPSRNPFSQKACLNKLQTHLRHSSHIRAFAVPRSELLRVNTKRVHWLPAHTNHIRSCGKMSERADAFFSVWEWSLQQIVDGTSCVLYMPQFPNPLPTTALKLLRTFSRRVTWIQLLRS